MPHNYFIRQFCPRTITLQLDTHSRTGHRHWYCVIRWLYKLWLLLLETSRENKQTPWMLIDQIIWWQHCQLFIRKWYFQGFTILLVLQFEDSLSKYLSDATLPFYLKLREIKKQCMLEKKRKNKKQEDTLSRSFRVRINRRRQTWDITVR